MALLEAARERLGADRILTGWKGERVEQDAASATVRFTDTSTGEARPPQRADAVVACDGIHSVVRRDFFPDEGPPIYSGVNMWRGTTRMRPVLSGATMVRAGWLAHGKMVIYPIRNHPDGTQMMNWVAEIETPSTAGTTGAGPGGSRTSCPPSRTGTSNGWTCRR